MTNIFISIHRYFKERKILFSVLLLGIIAMGGYSLYNINLEEDISNVLPKNGDFAKFENLIEKTSSGNTLIFILKSESKNVDSLVLAGQQLQESLKNNISDSLQHAINITNDQTVFIDLLASVYNHLYLYLSKEDLENINLDEAVLEDKISKKIKMLFTPAGSFMKQSITKDPLDLSLLALSKMQALQFDNNFQFVDACLISKDSTYLLGFVRLNSTIHKANQKTLLLEAVKKSLNELDIFPSISHYVFGAAIISEENAHRIKMDIMLTVNIGVSLLLLGMAFYYRSIKILPSFLIPILLGASVSLSLIYLRQPYLSAVALGMGSVLLGTIVDYSLHILTHLRKTGDSEETIRHTASPILAGSITTSVAFLCLLLVKSTALNDLATFAAFSMLFGALFAIVVLPVFYGNYFKNIKIEKSIIDNMMAYPIHMNKWILFLCLGIVLSSILFVKNIGFTKDLNELNYMPEYIQHAENELNNASNTLQSNLIVILENNSLNEALYRTEQLEGYLNHDLVGVQIDQVNSASSVLISQEKAIERRANWNTYWSQDKIDLIRKVLYQEADKLGIQTKSFDAFLAQFKNSIPPPAAIINSLSENYISEDLENGKVYSTVMIKLNKKDKAILSSKIKAYDNSIIVIDKSNMIHKLVEEVKSSLYKISFLLLFIILFILFIYFRNFEAVFLAFTPVLLSWLSTLGLMGLFYIDFNILNIIIVIFIFGLGIDYSIFVLSALISDYESGSTNFNTVKSAVFLSASTTFVGIGVLYFAKHPALNSIALAGIFAILTVFVYAIVLLPFLFQFLVKNRVKHKFEPITFESIYFTTLAYTTLLFGVVMITGLGFILYLFFFIPMSKRKNLFHKAFNFWAKTYVHIIYPGKWCHFKNEHAETFKKPGVIIANHQSLLDTPTILSLHPKIILLTKDWVRNSPIFGLGARLADFYSVEGDKDLMMLGLKAKVKEGFSIAIFPEGTRSKNKNTIRFHRGAFAIAEALELDIIPVMIHGTIDTLHKDQFIGQCRNLHLSILKRIEFSDKKFGNNSVERYKLIRDFYKKSYQETRIKVETPGYFKKQILSNYLYKNQSTFRAVKRMLNTQNYFEDLNHLFKNEKKTLIIDHSNGALSLVQNLVNETKQVDVLTNNLNIISNCYLISPNNKYYTRAEEIGDVYDQIFYIGKLEFNLDSIEKNRKESTKFIVLNPTTGEQKTMGSH